MKILSDVCSYINNKIHTSSIGNKYISTENMLSNKGGVTIPTNIPTSTIVNSFNIGDILISNIRPYFCKIWLATFSGGCSNDVLVIHPNNNIDNKFLYYVLSENRFFDHVMSSAKGTKMPRGDKKSIMNYKIQDFSLNIQRKIASILSFIDLKINTNSKINDNLEKQAQAIFNHYVVNIKKTTETYKTVYLTDIAQYLNGIAMQNFAPNLNEKRYPVLKIKELGQKMFDKNSDFCSTMIDKKYIVYDGDIIFSWSGTLLLDVWCGGICGLNQHLFKVIPIEYPKWFVYYWTNNHLNNFIRIAKDKAVTMGHIKRSDLEKAEVIVPSNDALNVINDIISPIFDLIIKTRIENRKLSLLRDYLIPKLMSGEISVEGAKI